MQDKIISYLEQLIKEHEIHNFCTSYEKAEESIETDVLRAFDNFYDIGRYDTLHEVLSMIQKLEE